MASTYSPNLKIELIATGEQANTWGDTTNNNFEFALEDAIVGYGSVSFAGDSTETISLTNSNTSQEGRKIFLNVTSAVPLTATRNLVVPTIEKTYIVYNNTTGSQSILVKTASGTGVTVPNGKKMLLYVNGTNVIQQADYFDAVQINSVSLIGTPTAPTASSGTNTTQIATTAFVNTEIAADTRSAPSSFVVSNSSGAIDVGATFTSTAASPAVLTFTGYTPVNGNRLYLYTTNTLPAGLLTNTLYYVVNSAGSTCQVSLTEGGTGVTTTTTGTGTHTGSLQKVIPTGTVVGTTDTQTLTNKTLTSPTINTATITGGTISGITDLAVADGGTGTSSLTANAVLLGNGTSAIQTVAPGTNGNILTSNGTTWTSAAPLTFGTAVTPTSVTFVDFTSIPSWAKQITLLIEGVSTTGTDDYLVQLITGVSTVVTSGYVSRISTSGGNSGATTGFRLTRSNPGAGTTVQGIATVINVSGNIWVQQGNVSTDNSECGSSAGSIALGAALTGIRFTTLAGTNDLDSGTVNIMYE